MQPTRLLGVMLAAATLMFGGCGSDEEAGVRVTAGEVPPPAGTLRVAAEGPVETLDPLLASTWTERIAARQVHEPLVSTQNGPFGQTRRRPGLARTLTAQADDTIWTARLRSGVRFGDGEAFDADAVKANAERWMAVAPGPAIVPELVAVDTPRPGLVRFFLDRASPQFPRTLARSELGMVAPAALEIAGTGPIRLGSSGTGPFELRERDGGRTLLARNASWWGSKLGLGPGVDQIELLAVDEVALRIDQLKAGSVEVATELDPTSSREIKADPLLAVVRSGGSILGLERSVRGIESALDDQALSDVWLTDLR